MKIRNSKSDDLQDILKLYEKARDFMASSCGIINVEDGTERIAFQRYSEKSS